MYATKSVIHRYLEDIPEHGTEVCVPLVLIAPCGCFVCMWHFGILWPRGNESVYIPISIVTHPSLGLHPSYQKFLRPITFPWQKALWVSIQLKSGISLPYFTVRKWQDTILPPPEPPSAFTGGVPSSELLVALSVRDCVDDWCGKALPLRGDDIPKQVGLG